MADESAQLLPSERSKVPDPEAMPKTVTTSDAFGGKPIRSNPRPEQPPKQEG